MRKNGRPAVWYSKEVSTFATAPSCDKVELVQSRMQWGLKKMHQVFGIFRRLVLLEASIYDYYTSISTQMKGIGPKLAQFDQATA